MTIENILDRKTNLKIKLLSHTPTPLQLIHAACTQCYNEGWAGDVEFTNIPETLPSVDAAYYLGFKGSDFFNKKIELIRKIIASGHTSVIEHVSFTFAISGISRALSHQLVRTRIGVSFSQQSQRYVNANEFSYIIPPKIEQNEKALDKYLEVMKYLADSYTELNSILKDAGHEKTANEDARFVLPNAAETKIVVTMNCRALLHFLAHRCCERAQWEIRALALLMLEEVSKVIPVVFEQSGAPCENLGYCPEDPKFSCGKYPVK